MVYSLGSKFVAEILGTMFGIYFGDSVVANALLPGAKGQSMGNGWISFGYGLAFFFPGVFFGHISGRFNPAFCLADLVLGQLSFRDFVVLSIADEALLLTRVADMSGSPRYRSFVTWDMLPLCATTANCFPIRPMPAIFRHMHFTRGASPFIGALLFLLHWPAFKTVPEPPALNHADNLLRKRDALPSNAVNIASYATRPVYKFGLRKRKNRDCATGNLTRTSN
eukprot:gene3198-13218_t